MTAATLTRTPVTDGRWEQHAACRGVPTNWFYLLTRTERVAPYCRDCPVIDACRADVEGMPNRLRWTGQYRAGRWWPARYAKRSLRPTDTTEETR